MATVKTPMIEAPGHTEATHEKGMNPEEERLMQCTPKTIAPQGPMVRIRPELLRANNLISVAMAPSFIVKILNGKF
jgi:hypothetical protein